VRWGWITLGSPGLKAFDTCVSFARVGAARCTKRPRPHCYLSEVNDF
jgi:hypothetical protein